MVMDFGTGQNNLLKKEKKILDNIQMHGVPFSLCVSFLVTLGLIKNAHVVLLYSRHRNVLFLFILFCF